jgi:hypothetical protein
MKKVTTLALAACVALLCSTPGYSRPAALGPPTIVVQHDELVINGHRAAWQHALYINANSAIDTGPFVIAHKIKDPPAGFRFALLTQYDGMANAFRTVDYYAITTTTGLDEKTGRSNATAPNTGPPAISILDLRATATEHRDPGRITSYVNDAKKQRSGAIYAAG